MTDVIEAKFITTENLEVGSGITIRDKATGKLKCLFVENNEAKATDGACGIENSIEASTPLSSDSETGSIIESLPETDFPLATEGSTPTPTPESGPELTPIPLTDNGTISVIEQELTTEQLPETVSEPISSPIPTPKPSISPTPVPIPLLETSLSTTETLESTPEQITEPNTE